MSQVEAKTILFFDGVCNLCNFFVQWLMKRDRLSQFRYASLQGETAQTRLDARLCEGLASVVVLTSDGQTLLRSEAVFYVLRSLSLPWPYRLLGLILSFLPIALTDAVYEWVARNRYRIFGRREICRVPTAKEKSFFLA
jgi:predicted DCC family thiol-disulfide oxidoreductase YuxK